MRAPAIRRKSAASFEELKPACQVLILHEDFSTYSRAVEVCRRIMERFASELDFDIKCWSFVELADPNCARHAAKTAGAADIILLSTLTTHLPSQLDQWLNLYFTVRFRKEGMLVLVLSDQANPPSELHGLLLRLKELAGRVGMDFIPLRPGDDAMVLSMLPAATAPRQIRR